MATGAGEPAGAPGTWGVWIPGTPPAGLTHNRLKVGRNGNVYKDDRLVAAEGRILPWLARARPAEPLDARGAPLSVRISLHWAGAEGAPMTGAPDWDNAAKVVCDLLQRAGWIADDRHVWEGTVSKLTSGEPGIYVEVSRWFGGRGA